MKFKEQLGDIVYFEATIPDKLALLQFIDASINDIDRHRVEMSCMGASQDVLEEIRTVIVEQSSNDKSIAMRRGLFSDMGSAARAWKTYGFDLAEPDEYVDIGVSKETIDTVLAMHAECFGI